MEGPEFILFGTTHLAGLAVIFAVMIALPKITNKYFSEKMLHTFNVFFGIDVQDEIKKNSKLL